jgi:hypothetical protein
MMIFINYRREDSKGITGRLHDRLATAFGWKNLFMDVDSIPPGFDFVRHIPILVDGARMPKDSDLPELLKPLARRNAISLRHDSFGRDADALIYKIRESGPATRSIWAIAVVSGLFVFSSVAIFYYFWPFQPASVMAYAADGNFACFDKAEYPDSWRAEAPLCGPYGCNFGKMSQDACLALGVRKQSKIVIHGNTGTTRANECWLQHSCGDLRPHGEFTLFKMSKTGFF